MSHPISKKIGRELASFHAFRRFPESVPQNEARTPLINFVGGHARDMLNDGWPWVRTVNGQEKRLAGRES
jgi:hypothetical protein